MPEQMSMATPDEERPLWFLTLTQACNLRCSYCGSSENKDLEDFNLHPQELSYDLERLKSLNNSPTPPIVCFYGGEPLLRMNIIGKVMDILDDSVTYVLQTNGILLPNLPTSYLQRLDTILLSIDGNERTTDRYRGENSYAKAILGASDVRRRGFAGDLVARMTVADGLDIEESVTHLLQLNIFDHIHWQLDVLWDSPCFARWENFLRWRDESYLPGLTTLVQRFAQEMRAGRVLPIAPFLGILYSMLIERPLRHIRCSSGWKAFNITTGGQITSCPIAPETETLGDITSKSFAPSTLYGSVPLGGACLTCDIIGDCGGRCLYANRTSWWGPEGFDAVCVTVRHLVKELRGILSECRQLLSNGVVRIEQFNYPRYNNSVEVIP